MFGGGGAQKLYERLTKAVDKFKDLKKAASGVGKVSDNVVDDMITVTHRGTNESILAKIKQGSLKANYPRPDLPITRLLEHSKPVVWVSEGRPTFWNRIWSGMVGKSGEASMSFKVPKSIVKKPDGWLKRWFGKSQRVIEQDITIPKDVIVRYKQ